MFSREEKEKEKENNLALIEELRRRLLSRGPELQDFDEEDIEKVQKSDGFVWQFLIHQHKDIDKALEMMVECLKWRESFGLNEITERNIDRHLFEIGFLFPRNTDKNGNLLLHFLANRYRKELYNIEEVKKLFAFALEKLCENNSGKKVTMVFDMQDAGFANMDMDLIKFLITCFQTYFPNVLEYLIVFETPWILITGWKLVKTWMNSDGISKIKFVKKNEINQFIAPKNLLCTMGGKDDYVYKYPPQLFTAKTQNNIIEANGVSSNHLTVNQTDVFSSISLNFDDKSVIQQQQQQQQQQQLSDEAANKTNYSKMIPSVQTEDGEPIVTIMPSHELLFHAHHSISGGEPNQILKIKNNLSKLVAFKVKTTSPENYRVKPSSGRIPGGETVEISVQLQPGHISGVSKDKFLIMSTILDGLEIEDLSNMWKTLPKASIFEQRLRCRYDSSATQSAESDRDSTISPHHIRTQDIDPLLILSKHLMEFDNKMNKMQKEILVLQSHIKMFIKLFIIFVAVSTLVLLAFILYLSRDTIKLFF